MRLQGLGDGHRGAEGQGGRENLEKIIRAGRKRRGYNPENRFKNFEVRKLTKVTDRDVSIIVILRGLGYSQKEIGEKLGFPQPTIRYHLRKLREEAGKANDLDEFYRKILFKGIQKPADVLREILASCIRETEGEEKMRSKETLGQAVAYPKDGGWKCKDCGSVIMAVGQRRSLWEDGFTGGFGEVIELIRSYCPKCDGKPKGKELPYAPPIYRSNFLKLVDEWNEFIESRKEEIESLSV